MNDIGLLVLAVVIGSIVVVAFLGSDQFVKGVGLRRAHCWRELAVRTRLTYHDGDAFQAAHVAGRYHNRLVRLESEGLFKPGFTRIQLGIYNPSNLEFRINERGLAGEIGYLLGLGIKTGYSIFDRRVSLRGRPKDFVVTLFGSASVRHRLMEANGLDINIRLAQGELEWRLLGWNRLDVNYLLYAFNLLSSLADRIETYDPAAASRQNEQTFDQN